MKFFCRKVGELTIGAFPFEDVIIDFGDIDPKGEIAGLIGLDIHRKLKHVIDVEIPIDYPKK